MVKRSKRVTSATLKNQMKLFDAIAATTAIGVSFVALPADINAQPVGSKRAESYKAAKKVMPPDLYLVYRVADRIITTNDIKRPIRVAVRNNVDCEGILGIASTSPKCQSIGLLPKIDKASNFDIWAAQVVGTMKGQANAAAYSDFGTIFLNTAMLKELTGKVEQVACVVAHELAHVTQNHSAEEREKAKELDKKTAVKVSESVRSARNSQNAYIAAMAIMGGINAGLGNSTYSTDSALNNLRVSAMLARPRIAKAALEQQPAIGQAFNEMQGLAGNFVNQAIERIQYNLRDYSLELAGFNRAQEYEADLLGTKYVATAGFNPKSCIKLWTETMNHSEDKLIEKLLPEGIKDPGKGSSSESGLSLEKIRKAAMKATMANSRLNEEKEKDKEPDYKKVPEDVLEALKSHPDNLSRAAAIKKYLATLNSRSLAARGKSKLNTVFVRNWSYDEDSESTVISDSFTSPDRAGSRENGITGIDVDASLGF